VSKNQNRYAINMRQERRSFIKRIFLLSLLSSGLNAFLMACSGGTSSSGNTTPVSGGDCQANGTSVAVGGNHGHGAPTISAADVTAGVQQAYTVTSGSAGHSHTVTVTSGDFTTLQGNTGVAINTDADGTGHSHSITINCA
jgi:hypothetical protein